MFAFYGWILYAFVNYRYVRREELLQVLAGAAENDLPLAPALRAYLHDRPRGDLREFWVATLLFFPFLFYYWIWHRQNSFDRKLERVAELMEQGLPLFQALEAVPGVASRDMVLAAAIGQVTGQLSQCLKRTARRRLGELWIEMLPQIVYVVLVPIILLAIVSFLMYFIVPKFRKIFSDFSMRMPSATLKLIAVSNWVVDYYYIVFLAVLLIVALGLVLFFNSTARWFFPGLGNVYRRLAQSRVLRLLSMLLETGRTVPHALSHLEELPLGRSVVRRIRGAKYRIERGEPLAECLLEAGLLPAAMLPLVRISERTGNLPWILGELADAIYNRTIVRIKRIAQAMFPAVVISMGLLVGGVVYAMFLPIVTLITELSG
jgi:type II secretory pathway component PulF